MQGFRVEKQAELKFGTRILQRLFNNIFKIHPKDSHDASSGEGNSLVTLNKLRYPLLNPKIELQIFNFITEQNK